MSYPILQPKSLFRRKTIKDDAMAGVVLGVESVPDGLASGLLAGVNPVFGLYGYLYGLVGGALFTSTAFMAVQATGAMSIIVADVDLGSRDDPARALFTLTILTGTVMILAGLLKLGSFLRFVSNSVMTGFITAVGINIALGQVDDFTGYETQGDNRILRLFDAIIHPTQLHWWTIAVGLFTIFLIVWLQRTRLGALGMVIAIFAGSGVARLLGVFDVEIFQVSDIVDVPRSLPLPKLPLLREIPVMIIPAFSLAFVGLVQGAGVSAGFPSDDGSLPDHSQDFVGQGAGNVLAGLFQGMPVGGSMSASSIIANAGAKSRTAHFFAAAVMAIVILLFTPAIELVAMPSLAALLIVVGVATVKPAKIMAVARTGTVPLTIMSITLVLTMLIPLQFSVLVGVGLSVIMFVIRQSSRLVTRRILFHDDDRLEEVDPPLDLPANEVVVLHPYGPIFFASATTLVEQMPSVTPSSKNSVVILRVRGADDAGATLIDVLRTYARALREVDSKLVIVTNNPRLIEQIDDATSSDVIGQENLYRGTAFMFETVKQAYDDAEAWVAEHLAGATSDTTTDDTTNDTTDVGEDTP